MSALRAQLPQRLTAAVAWLFHLVEHSYLLEFLMFDHLSIRMARQDFFLPGHPEFALGALVIAIGEEEVRLDPIGLHGSEACVRISNTRHDLVRDLFCDLADEQPGWTAAVDESGLRRLIQAILPEKRVDLDEALFRTMLNQVLLGPQPMFSVDRSAVRYGLGVLLDHVTSDPVRHKLALGVRSSATQLGQHLALAAPVARDAVRKALPGRRPLPDGLAHEPARIEHRGSDMPDRSVATGKAPG